MHGPADKLLLLLPLLIAVVVGGHLVFAPSRSAGFWFERVQRFPEGSQGSLERGDSDFRLLLQLRRRPPPPLQPLNQLRKRDQRTKRPAPALHDGKVRVQ